MDRGTIIRTIVLMIALINQFLVIFGKSPLPIDSALVEQLVSTLFTLIMSLHAWFKNNYLTSKGRKQREILEKHGLTGRKRK
ncbi:phage holin [Oceanobacillus piezotolerans]|uniref:Phage holin n=1 Tax=Oceanobacillus piezotolerans TaxID=2448030 RepID=A0A498DDU8_9BACI|nr:phage holin [Oceanobacillus piezotolerans]